MLCLDLWNFIQGKSMIVHRFLEKDETPKPTIAMDYSFGRKAGKSLVSSSFYSDLWRGTIVTYKKICEKRTKFKIIFS